MDSYNWADFGALAPVVILVVGGCALLISEVFLTSRERAYQAWLSFAFAALAGVVAYAQLDDPARDLFGGFARHDAFGSFAAIVICFALALTSLVAASHLKELASERGEFHALAQFGAVGMILLAQTTDLLTLFVSLEVMSLATYALTAWLRTSAKPAEAGLKYFILGSFSSAVFLYGASLAYGAAGSTRLTDIAAAVSTASGSNFGLLVAALALIGGGFLFKVAAVPFHMWAPDVYEGAPSPVTGFMAAGVKVAAFAAMLRTMYVAFGAESFATGIDPLTKAVTGRGWYDALAVIAIVTMVVGNLLAIAQCSVKRMLAYSSIAHAGYLLVGVAVGAFGATRAMATQAVLFYLAAYTATAIGAFAVVSALEKRGGSDSDVDTRYDGLAQRHPALAFAMAIFMLSLAGIPLTAGFTAKLFIFRAALEADAVGLAVIGLLSSVAGLYYYLRVLVVMYMRPVREGAPQATSATAIGLGIGAAAAATILLGVGPGLIGELTRAASILGQ